MSISPNMQAPNTQAPDMQAPAYEARRARIEAYFDRTAARTWERLTSDAPVSRIRQTVRAGRDTMRETLLSWLPDDLRGRRVLDAGCGTGAMAVELARRGADVVGTDLSPTLLDTARTRLPADCAGRITLIAGDMRDPALGHFDHMVAMDSLIHYPAPDACAVLADILPRIGTSALVTFAPRTALLGLMHGVGRLFPRGDRAPMIEPVAERDLRSRIAAAAPEWTPARTRRVESGFYISQGLELVRPASKAAR